MRCLKDSHQERREALTTHTTGRGTTPTSAAHRKTYLLRELCLLLPPQGDFILFFPTAPTQHRIASE
eukprot:3767119-Pyramimonas_sp.AAC.1